MSSEIISLLDQTTPPASKVWSANDQPAGATLPAPAGWPRPPADEAFHGLPGAIVAKIAPNTEGDPVAILTQLLVACGALIGRGAHFQVEATLHHPNQFLLLIGDSSRARKGSSLDHVTKLLSEVDPVFPFRLTTGLSSGEGLVWKVRDPNGQDRGAEDKRLLVIEPEFASVLKSTNREISTLSPTLRSAGRSAARAADPHRPRPRHRRAHLDHRAHHRHRATPPHHPGRARQRLHEQVRARLGQTDASPARRR